MKLKDIFNVLSEYIETSSPDEIFSACELIIEVQDMTQAEKDCIIASYKSGPLYDGDVPCKSSRDKLLSSGFMEKVVVKGEDGFNACNHKGAWAFRLIAGGACD